MGAVLIEGMKGCGKTETARRRAASEVLLDSDPDAARAAELDPRLVLESGSPLPHAYAQLSAHPATVSTILKRAHGDVEVGSGAPSRYTVEPYLDALRRMMIVDEIPAWDPSVRSSKRLVSTPKRMLGDSSLAASLLGLSSKRMLEELNTLGFLFECLASHDLRIYAEAAGAECYHYREHDARLEVDYVLETRDGERVGIEVNLGDSQIDQAAESLRRLADRVARPPKALVVVTAGSLVYTREGGVHVVPLGCLQP